MTYKDYLRKQYLNHVNDCKRLIMNRRKTIMPTLYDLLGIKNDKDKDKNLVNIDQVAPKEENSNKNAPNEDFVNSLLNDIIKDDYVNKIYNDDTKDRIHDLVTDLAKLESTYPKETIGNLIINRIKSDFPLPEEEENEKLITNIEDPTPNEFTLQSDLVNQINNVHFIGSYNSIDELKKDYAEMHRPSPNKGDVCMIKGETYVYNGTYNGDFSFEKIIRGFFIKIPVIMITGKGGCGKDTIISSLDPHIVAYNISSIDPIKEALSILGVNPDDKEDKTRAYMHNLKMLSQEYNDYPNVYCEKQVKKIIDAYENYPQFPFNDPPIIPGINPANGSIGCWFPVIFLHIREKESREAFKEIFNNDPRLLGLCTLYSCLVTRDVTDNKVYGNHCDDDAGDDHFDFIVKNDDLQSGINQMNMHIIDHYWTRHTIYNNYFDDARNNFIEGYTIHKLHYMDLPEYMKLYFDMNPIITDDESNIPEEE